MGREARGCTHQLNWPLHNANTSVHAVSLRRQRLGMSVPPAPTTRPSLPGDKPHDSPRQQAERPPTGGTMAGHGAAAHPPHGWLTSLGAVRLCDPTCLRG